MKSSPLAYILLTVLLSLSAAVRADVVAAQEVDSTGVSWSLSADGVLTLSGQGWLPSHWTSAECAPWYAYSEAVRIVRAEQGVRSIGPWAFSGYPNLTQVSLPASLDSLGTTVDHAQSGTESLTQQQRTGIGPNPVPWAPFAQCRALQSVVWLAENPYLQTAAFDGCGALLFFVPEGWRPSRYNRYGAADISYYDLPAVHDTTLVEVHDTTYVELHDTLIVAQTDTLIIDRPVAPEYIRLRYCIDERVEALIPAAKGDSVQLCIRPEEGWEIVSLRLDSIELSDGLTDSLYTTPALHADATLTLRLAYADDGSLYTEDDFEDGIIRTRHGLKVSQSDSTLAIEGAEGSTISVYTLGGALVKAVQVQRKRALFSLPPAVYILRIGEETLKIQIR